MLFSKYFQANNKFTTIFNNNNRIEYFKSTKFLKIRMQITDIEK